jgi:hypothetical protein
MEGRSLDRYEAIVREKICSVCSDQAVNGGCGLQQPSECALFRLFPQVAAAILATCSDDIQDYVNAIREHVCAQCGERQADGTCIPRREVRCALDAYLVLVVEAIEEATGRVFEAPHVMAGQRLTTIEGQAMGGA